ncbi:MAG: hypothetical protein ABI792_07620 [bacterium]
MEKEKHILINNIHRYFGVEFNNTAWKYFAKENKTQEDMEDMIGYAQSSLLHWKLFSGGTFANVQRGEYMVAKAYALAGNKSEAIKHAERCYEITEKHAAEMEDFDFAFADEIMALANDLTGNKNEFQKYKALAEKKGNEIKDEKDRKVFFDTFTKYITSV